MCASASQSILDPNDSHLTEQILDVWVPGPPESRFAKALAAAGEPAMAERADYCGRFCKMKCPQGHLDIHRQRCGGPFCSDCGPRMLKEVCNRWDIAIHELMQDAPAAPAVYIEARIPQSYDRDAAEKEFSRIQGGDAFSTIHWKRLVGYQNGRLIIRLLAVEPNLCTQHTRPSDWAKLIGWPEGTIISSESVHMFQLWWFFENRLMVPYIPKDPDDCGVQQALFKGMHRFRAVGASLTQSTRIPPLSEDSPKTEDFFTEEVESPVKMSEESPIQDTSPTESTSKRRSCCSTCGLPHVEQSQWFAKDAHNPRPSECRWHPTS